MRRAEVFALAIACAVPGAIAFAQGGSLQRGLGYAGAAVVLVLASAALWRDALPRESRLAALVVASAIAASLPIFLPARAAVALALAAVALALSRASVRDPRAAWAAIAPGALAALSFPPIGIACLACLAWASPRREVALLAAVLAIVAPPWALGHSIARAGVVVAVFLGGRYAAPALVGRALHAGAQRALLTAAALSPGLVMLAGVVAASRASVPFAASLGAALLGGLLAAAAVVGVSIVLGTRSEIRESMTALLAGALAAAMTVAPGGAALLLLAAAPLVAVGGLAARRILPRSGLTRTGA